MSGFIVILCLHWIADFVFQTDWMAKNKSTNFMALSSHIIVYFLIMFLGMSLVYSFWPAFSFALINGALHFVVDALTSRMSSYFWKKNDTHSFFVVIGADQLIHNICLYMSYVLLVS